MMVATGLPITPQPTAATPPAADAPPDAAAPEGGFLGTLMQMLAPQDPAEVAGAGAAAVVTQLLDEAAGDAPEDVPLPDGSAALVAPVLFPAVQPAEIRAAQQLARGSGDGGEALATLSDAAAAPALDASASLDLATADRLVGGSGPALPAPSADASALGLQGSMTPPTAVDSTAPGRAAPVDTPVPRQIQTPVGAPGWSDELGTQLHLMADKGHSIASLRLSPEHLGPLEVQISVQDNQASVWFGSTNGDTRAALEQAMPRLRELFAAQGMSLMQSGVFNQSARDPGRQAAAAAAVHGAVAEGAMGTEPGLPVAVRHGLVDAYA